MARLKCSLCGKTRSPSLLGVMTLGILEKSWWQCENCGRVFCYDCYWKKLRPAGFLGSKRKCPFCGSTKFRKIV